MIEIPYVENSLIGDRIEYNGVWYLLSAGYCGSSHEILLEKMKQDTFKVYMKYPGKNIKYMGLREIQINYV